MNLFNDGDRLCLLSGEGMYRVADRPPGLSPGAPETMSGLLAGGERRLDALRALQDDLRGEWRAPPDDSAWRPGPVVDRPGKIVCVGLNYRAHAAETGGVAPAQPVLFGKFANALAGHNQPVDISGLERVDYEAELGVMIGRRARRVAESRALDHVLGYFNANDLSERRLQFLSGQWLLGKSLPRFLPTGPYLRVHDDGIDPQNLAIRGWLNGELRQNSNTSDMIFSVAELIAYVSRYMALEAGDLLITGTPEGVILGRDERVWMQPGDRYTVEIEGLGRLRTPLVDDTGQSHGAAA